MTPAVACRRGRYRLTPVAGPGAASAATGRGQQAVDHVAARLAADPVAHPLRSCVAHSCVR